MVLEDHARESLRVARCLLVVFHHSLPCENGSRPGLHNSIRLRLYNASSRFKKQGVTLLLHWLSMAPTSSHCQESLRVFLKNTSPVEGRMDGVSKRRLQTGQWELVM